MLGPYSLGHLKMVLRLVRCACSQIFLQEPPDGWVKLGSSIKADVLAKDNGKCNHDGKHLFHGALRDNRHLCKDVRTAVALQFHHLLVQEGLAQQLIEDFEPREVYDTKLDLWVTARPWMDWYIIPGFRTGGRQRDVFKTTSSKTQRKHFKKAADVAGITLQKNEATHARRKHALQAHTSGMGRQAKARYGQWTADMGRMEIHYEDPLEWGVMAQAAGHVNTASNALQDRWACMTLCESILGASLPLPLASVILPLEQQLDARRTQNKDILACETSFVEYLKVRPTGTLLKRALRRMHAPAPCVLTSLQAPCVLTLLR